MPQIPNHPPRPGWNAYFMSLAREVSTRATCDRKHVGAVLVRDRVVLCTGYNGSMRGLAHCDEAGHMMEDGHCVRTVHAEANAVAQAARNGIRTDGATCYTTASPCWPCLKLLGNAGVLRVIYGEAYRFDERLLEASRSAGIELGSLVGEGDQLVVAVPLRREGGGTPTFLEPMG